MGIFLIVKYCYVEKNKISLLFFPIRYLISPDKKEV